MAGRIAHASHYGTVIPERKSHLAATHP
jgi:hypothetical protein